MRYQVQSGDCDLIVISDCPTEAVRVAISKFDQESLSYLSRVCGIKKDGRKEVWQYISTKKLRKDSPDGR